MLQYVGTCVIVVELAAFKLSLFVAVPICLTCPLPNVPQLCGSSALQVLLDAGADPFAVDQSGCNALLLAAGCGSAPSVRLLLQEGCVDADYHNSDMGAGGHALLVAAEGGWEECVGLLLSAGAKVNRTDKAGRTALWVASR